MVVVKRLMFREAKPEDGDGVAELLRQLGSGALDGAEARRRLDRGWETVFVAADPIGDVWGFVAVKKELYFGHARPVAHVTAIAVHQAARRSGIGRGLMEQAAAFAREQQCAGIELTSGINPQREAAHHFYQSLGYIRTSYRYWLPFDEEGL
ncbi:MAG TPA: GNAT family N-acetyltransferase [Chloroflexota bacterium]|nr:GNAT family N-acetyltransferase [Chloroflexota bacterium]